MTTLEAGKRYRVEFEAECVNADNNGAVLSIIEWRKLFSDDELAAMTITEVERPLKVGDAVRHTASGDQSRHGVILAVDGDEAWVRWDSGYRGGYPLSHLTRLPTGGA